MSDSNDNPDERLIKFVTGITDVDAYRAEVSEVAKTYRFIGSQIYPLRDGKPGDVVLYFQKPKENL